MSEKDRNLLKNLAFLKKRLNPETYYKELAEMDLLEEFVDTYLKDKFDSDTKFQAEVFQVIFEGSDKIVPDLEVFLLEKLIHSFSYFNQMLSEWTIQDQ
jgi:exoribonuclease II